ncbi:MAG: LysR family transcriptional regulator [Burkholderiales bacterium]
MDRFQAISTFARVVEAGSFAGAAKRLGVSVSSVSRLVAELEAHLGSRLLNRTTRRISLTEAGRVFHERSVQLLADLEEAEASASEGAAVPRGTLRLSCPVSFGIDHIAPVVADFMRRHPAVKLELELSDRVVDLVDEGFDAAVRIGAVRGQNLVARRVGTSRLVCCASPGYLATHGEPRTPEDLARHACLLYQYAPQRDTWLFTGKDGEELRMRVSGPAYANNGDFLAALAREGIGIAYEPDFIVGGDVRAKALVPILRGYSKTQGSINVVYASRRHLSAKVRAFADFLAQRFAGVDWSDARSVRSRGKP